MVLCFPNQMLITLPGIRGSGSLSGHASRKQSSDAAVILKAHPLHLKEGVFIFFIFHISESRRQQKASCNKLNLPIPRHWKTEALHAGKASDGWYNCRILPSGKIDSVGVCWGKGEAVGSIRTWKIMKPTNLLSITGSYFNCTGRLEK